MSRISPIPASWLAFRPPGVAIGLALYRGLCPRCGKPAIAVGTVPAGDRDGVAPCDGVPHLIAGLFDGLASPVRNPRYGERLDLVPHACARDKAPHEYDPALLRTCSRCNRARPWTDAYCPRCGNPEFGIPGRPKKRPKALKAKGGGN